jgi:hypothetical protein
VARASAGGVGWQALSASKAISRPPCGIVMKDNRMCYSIPAIDHYWISAPCDSPRRPVRRPRKAQDGRYDL